ncbi:MAG: M20/M25/M40 family metallo-hydrolase [Halobacteriales archaeon]
METDEIEFLERLIDTPSPSGYEADVLGVWRDRVEGAADEVETDSYGNTRATLNPEGELDVVVAGHADEIGMMTNHVTDDGYLRVKRVGGLDAGVGRARRVVVHGDDGALPGVTGRKPVHLQDEDEDSEAEAKDIYVDLGMESREQVMEAGVRVGSPITYEVGLQRLAGDVVAGRGIDNRVGVWVAGEVLRLVKDEDLDVTLHAVATVQEELGLRGARMTGYSLDPDVALAVDVTFATDVPDVDEDEHGSVAVGDGPTLKHGKENHPVVVEGLRRTAENQGLDVQDEAIMTRGATDGDAFYVSRGGVPTASIGLPNRYMHTPAEVVSLDDLEGCRDLLASYVADLDSGVSYSVL